MTEPAPDHPPAAPTEPAPADLLSVDPIVAIGHTPVAGASPTGADIRDDPEFESVQALIDVMAKEGPKAVAWPDVVRVGTALLETRTKDLLLAVYVCYGLYHTDGLKGLAQGLGLIDALLATFWDSLFPPKRRERARVNAMEWLAERLGPMVAEETVTPDRWNALIAVHEVAVAIDGRLREKLEKSEANLGPLIRTLREHARAADHGRQEAEKKAQAEAAKKAAAEAKRAAETDKAAAPTGTTAAPSDGTAPVAAKETAPPRSAVAATAVPAAAPVAPAPPPPPTIAVPTGGNQAEVDRALRGALSGLASFARQLRQGNPGDPRAYVLTRTAAWMNVNQPPPNEDGTTRLPEPAADTLRPIENAVAADNHAAAINLAEDAFSDSIYWLDAHRIVANALDGLGPPYERARRAVTGQMIALLTRVPELPTLRFAGGRPFADDRTRLWLQEEVMPKADGGNSAGTGGGADAELNAAVAACRKLAVAGKLKEGLSHLAEGRRGAADARGRFLWDLAQARFCLDAGYVDLAIPVLSHLRSRIESAGFESWEPALCVEVNALLYKAYTHADSVKTLPEEDRKLHINALRDSLCRLDMATAASLLHPS